MNIQQNLSQLFYIKNDPNRLRNEPHSFVKKLDSFNLNGNSIQDTVCNQYFIHPLVTADTRFSLTTIYPGLILGAGYSHPALHKVDTTKKNDLSDFQLGFFFDHTTGLPVIPGSSVKGVLKSVFPKKDFPFKEEKLEYIRSLLPDEKRQLIDFINWQKIFFERKLVFLDAYIAEIPPDGKILEDDNITPHTAGIFKNPIPIRFLKVAPGVTFTFQFLLKNYMKSDLHKLTASKEDEVVLSVHDIKEVFKNILIDFGIGAKRNVGYGQLK